MLRMLNCIYPEKISRFSLRLQTNRNISIVLVLKFKNWDARPPSKRALELKHDLLLSEALNWIRGFLWSLHYLSSWSGLLTAGDMIRQFNLCAFFVWVFKQLVLHSDQSIQWCLMKFRRENAQKPYIFLLFQFRSHFNLCKDTFVW